MHMHHREICENDAQVAPSEWDPMRMRSSFFMFLVDHLF